MEDVKMFTMDDIMQASFGESSQTIRANFKRTINVRQYETETVELSSILEINRTLTGIERMLISAILQCQLEYEAYIQLHTKGYITDSEFCDRKAMLEKDINMLACKGEELLNKPIEYLFNLAQKDTIATVVDESTEIK